MDQGAAVTHGSPKKQNFPQDGMKEDSAAGWPGLGSNLSSATS
jgi:hypothetical protein